MMECECNELHAIEAVLFPVMPTNTIDKKKGIIKHSSNFIDNFAQYFQWYYL